MREELQEDCGIEDLYGGPARAPQTPHRVDYSDVGKTRRVKDRMEELSRSDPEEFYRRKKVIRDEIYRRKKGKPPKDLKEFTLEELEEILHDADKLYRPK